MATTNGPGRADGRSRPRAATDRKIEQAVLSIMESQGPGAVTMERVSEVSGVARTTLYRRYRNRFDLLQGVAERVTPALQSEPELSLDGLTRVLEQVERVFVTAGVRELVGQMLGAEEEFLGLWRERFLAPRTEVLQDFLARGVEAGVLVPGADDGVVVDLVFGAALVGAMTQDAPTEERARATAAMLWNGIAAG